ncbi:MAG: hypothetical protein LBS31_11535, partial [Candidatus Adiutrix sp.]|nr:hypothetical protein [Candidatus Adiutrix sp.]
MEKNRYKLIASEIYSHISMEQYDPILNDICQTCGLAKRPISESIYGEARTHIHSSKQWEYP